MSKTTSNLPDKAENQAQLRRELLRLILQNEARRQSQTKAANS
jgi:hypothetical protein